MTASHFSIVGSDRHNVVASVYIHKAYVTMVYLHIFLIFNVFYSTVMTMKWFWFCNILSRWNWICLPALSDRPTSPSREEIVKLMGWRWYNEWHSKLNKIINLILNGTGWNKYICRESLSKRIRLICIIIQWHFEKI